MLRPILVIVGLLGGAHTLVTGSRLSAAGSPVLSGSTRARVIGSDSRQFGEGSYRYVDAAADSNPNNDVTPASCDNPAAVNKTCVTCTDYIELSSIEADPDGDPIVHMDSSADCSKGDDNGASDLKNYGTCMVSTGSPGIYTCEPPPP